MDDDNLACQSRSTSGAGGFVDDVNDLPEALDEAPDIMKVAVEGAGAMRSTFGSLSSHC